MLYDFKRKWKRVKNLKHNKRVEIENYSNLKYIAVKIYIRSVRPLCIFLLKLHKKAWIYQLSGYCLN